MDIKVFQPQNVQELDGVMVMLLKDETRFPRFTVVAVPHPLAPGQVSFRVYAVDLGQPS